MVHLILFVLNLTFYIYGVFALANGEEPWLAWFCIVINAVALLYYNRRTNKK